jgi:tRNA threonylcarbamoyladenosine modification (KEOPS) complex Cgi121 subunit
MTVTFIGFLGRGVQADRVIDVVVFGEGHPCVAAIDARTRRVDQMLHAAVAAALKHIHEAHQIAVDVGIGIEQRVAHPGLRRQVDHALETFVGKQRRHRLPGRRCPSR